jgi:predicted ATPase
VRIATIEVHGYKKLRNAKLSPLAAYNAVIGPNNSGKSSIAQAVTYIGHHANGGRSDAPFFPAKTADFADFQNKHLSDDGYVALEVDDGAGQDAKRLLYRPDKVQWNKLQPAGRDFGTGLTTQEVVQAQRKTSAEEQAVRQLASEVEKRIRYFGPFERIANPGQVGTTHVLGRKAMNLATVLHLVRNNDLRTFAEIERHFQVTVGDYSQIYTPLIKNNHVSVSLVSRAGESHELVQVGEGIARCLCVITALLTSPPECLIFLEEPEFGLHPSLQRRLRRTVQTIVGERKHQLVVLTHSAIWAAVGPSGQLFQMTGEGAVMNARNLDAARGLLGSRPSDAGWSDLIPFVEGESEATAMPLLFEAADEPMERLGVYPYPLRGASRPSLVRAEVELAQARGQRVHVCLDWADHKGRSHREMAKDFGVGEDSLTLWRKEESGSHGVFEDVLSAQVLHEALKRQAGPEAEIPSLDDFQQQLRAHGGKTSDFLKRIYRGATKESWDKPDFNRMAAEVCVQRGEQPPQVSSLIRRIQSQLE